MFETELPIVTLYNIPHPLNAAESIVVTELGMTMVLRAVHIENVSLCTAVIDSLSET